MRLSKEILIENQDKIESIKDNIVRENLEHVKDGSLMDKCSINEAVSYLSALSVSLGEYYDTYLNTKSKEEASYNIAALNIIDKKVEEIVTESLSNGITNLEEIIIMMLSCTGNIYTAIKAMEQFEKEYNKNKGLI